MKNNSDLAFIKEYIRLLKSKKEDHFQFLPDDYENHYKSIHSISKEDANRDQIQFLNSIKHNKDVMPFVAKRFLAAIPEDLAERLADIHVASVGVLGFGAKCLLAPSGTPFILINGGLLNCLYDLSTLFVASLDTAYHKAFMSIINSSLLGYLNIGYHYTGDSDYFFPRIELDTQKQIGIAGAILENARNFILAHEYSHILLGHLSGEISQNSDQPDGPNLKMIEYEADEFAIKLTLQAAMRYQKNVGVGILGVLFALSVMKSAESLFKKEKTGKTHPPAFFRYWRATKLISPLLNPVSLQDIKYLDKYFDKIYSLGRAINNAQSEKGGQIRDYIVEISEFYKSHPDMH